MNASAAKACACTVEAGRVLAAMQVRVCMLYILEGPLVVATCVQACMLFEVAGRLGLNIHVISVTLRLRP